MAQNVTIAGASYTDVPSIAVPKTGGGTASFTDVSPTTAVAGDVANGKIFFLADGTQGVGTSSGGGGGSYELLGQTSLNVNTTSTSATVIHTFNFPSAWTYQKILYVRVRRTEVPSSGYFYGSDTWFINGGAFNGSTNEQTSGLRTLYKVNASQKWGSSTNMAYGVYPRGVSPNGDVAISSRYSSMSSGTLNGTFKVEVYLLNWPDNVTPFAPLS